MEATENAPAMALEAQVEMPVMAVTHFFIMINIWDPVAMPETVVTEEAVKAKMAEMQAMAETEIHPE